MSANGMGWTAVAAQTDEKNINNLSTFFSAGIFDVLIP